MGRDFNFETGEILLVDKEIGWTSFDVVAKIRSSFKPLKIKIGHAGTLDPFATGLLILCTGKFTKRIIEFQEMKKVYSGTMRFGATTPSFDLDTPIDQTFNYNHITENDILNATKKFIGEIEQTPPIYSAIKLQGERLYRKAMRGESVVIPKRIVDIYSFEITDIRMPDIDFIISCSKGTYIRSVASDFGKMLNSGGHLIALRRECIGDFDVREGRKVQEWVELIDDSVFSY